MKIERARLADLVPDQRNARKHSSRNIDEVMRSLKEFGQHAPLVVQRSSGRVLVGNARLEAMQRLGWSECAVMYVDDDDVKAVKRALADNKTGDLSGWHKDVLEGLIKEIRDLEEVEIPEIPGFDEAEIADILDEDLDDVDEPPEVPFAEELNERHDYVVLYFDNEIDWLQAQTLFGLEPRKALHTRGTFSNIGTGRVIKGKEAIEKIKAGLREHGY